ncbi:hypothetical protein AAC387_Pa09g0840 [Persea americana]
MLVLPIQTLQPPQHHNQTSSLNNPDCPSSPSLSELPHDADIVTCNKIPLRGIDTTNPFSILEHCTLVDPSSFVVDLSPQDLNQPPDLSQPNSQVLATVQQVTARPSRSLKMTRKSKGGNIISSGPI